MSVDRSTAITRRTVIAWLLAATAALLGCAPQPPASIRVLTYNIHHGEGLDGRIDLQRIADVVRETGADLVALQEVDREVRRSGGVDQSRRLAELTGLHAVFAGNIELQGGGYGNAVLSRYPITTVTNHKLPLLGDGEQRGLLEVHLRVDDREIVFFATHLDHRPDDAERLASVAVLREQAGCWADLPVIVAGDLNARPDGRVIADTTTFLADTCKDDSPDAQTYPADEPERRIDYVLYNRHPSLSPVEYCVIPEAVASDHRPVLAVFEIVCARDASSR